jgi:hypothetical protein
MTDQRPRSAQSTTSSSNGRQSQPNGEGSGTRHLTDRGLIRVLDLVFVTKGEDGAVAGLVLADIDSTATRPHGVRRASSDCSARTTTMMRAPCRAGRLGRDPALRELGPAVRRGRQRERRAARRKGWHPAPDLHEASESLESANA